MTTKQLKQMANTMKKLEKKLYQAAQEEYQRDHKGDLAWLLHKTHEAIGEALKNLNWIETNQLTKE